MSGLLRVVARKFLQAHVARSQHVDPRCARFLSSPHAFTTLRIYSTSKSSKDWEPPQDGPIKYTTSKAHSHSSYDTFLNPENTTPYYQTFIILFSISVFLIYFLVLREENDLDEELGKTLYDKIPGLEEKTRKAQALNQREIEEKGVSVDIRTRKQ